MTENRHTTTRPATPNTIDWARKTAPAGNRGLTRLSDLTGRGLAS